MSHPESRPFDGQAPVTVDDTSAPLGQAHAFSSAVSAAPSEASGIAIDSVPAALATTASEAPVHVAPLTRAFPIRTPVDRRRATDRRWIGHALLTTGKLALLTFIAYGLMFNFSVVRGSSMAPGIHDGDRILVNHLSYVFQDVHRGDIVVLRYPLDPSLDYIKRVIGLPGDVVEIESGCVRVNGEMLTEPYVAAQDPHAHVLARVEPDHFFVLGDNRRHSSDSREFGQVPRENLRGKVDLRVWPPSRAGTLH
jgi:signal peptidase I